MNKVGLFKNILLILFFIFLPIQGFSESWEYPYNNTQREINKPLFMKDNFYTNTNKIILNDYFSYRKPIINSSYNIEKGKILTTLIGKQNSINLENKLLFQIKAKNSIFLLNQLTQLTEQYNKANFLILQSKNN